MVFLWFSHKTTIIHWIFAPFSISSSLLILSKHQGPPFGVAMPGHLRGEIPEIEGNWGLPYDAAKYPPYSIFERNRLWVSRFNHSLKRFIPINQWFFFRFWAIQKALAMWCPVIFGDVGLWVDWRAGISRGKLGWAWGNPCTWCQRIDEKWNICGTHWKTIYIYMYRISPSRRFASTHGGFPVNLPFVQFSNCLKLLAGFK